MKSFSTSTPCSRPRFVVLRHQMPSDASRRSHWDLMLEDEGQLLTWALVKLPQLSQTCPAELLAAHRMAYLEYEGAVSNDRGHVTRWDAGTFCWQSRTPERYEITLLGAKLRGAFVLQLDAAPDNDSQRWLLSWSSSDESAT